MIRSPEDARDDLYESHPCFGCEVRSAAVCAVLDCSDLARFKRLGGTVRLDPGQPLFRQGEPVNRVYSLTRGTMRLYRLLPDGRRQITGFLFPGDFLGISREAEHGCTAEAMEPAQLCSFPTTRFDSFVRAQREMEGQLYRMAANELTAAQDQMVLLGRKTAVERLASFFATLLGRVEHGQGGKVAAFSLPMSRADIADYLGLTKETVSRVLAQLRSRRIVRLQALDRVEVLDRERLLATAQGRTGRS